MMHDKIYLKSTQPDSIFLACTNMNKWVLKIQSDGKILLNPDVPQDEAVKAFLEILEQMLVLKTQTKETK